MLQEGTVDQVVDRRQTLVDRLDWRHRDRSAAKCATLQLIQGFQPPQDVTGGSTR
jgi:hypothetical protein